MPRNQNPELSPTQARALRKRVLTMAVVLLIIVAAPVVYFGVFFNAGSPNALCTVCHEMEGAYQTWTKSQHSGTPCWDCHTGAPSVAKMFMVKMQSRHSGGMETAHVDQKACVDCHKGKIKQDMIVVRGIKLSHKTHFSKNIPCLACHSETAHGETPAAAMLVAGSGMSANCQECHDDLHGGASDCNVCHTPKGIKYVTYSPAATGKKQPHHRDAKESSQDCTKCHSRQYCYGCHVTNSPHKEGFDHAKASREDGRFCTQCHDFDFCSDCHKIKAQHTADDWKDNHGVFKDKIATCEGLQCHNMEDKKLSCNRCHSKLGSPFKLEGEDKQHPDEFVKSHPMFASKDAGKCLLCHNKSFCTACHQGKRIHEDGWSMGHATHLNKIAKKGMPRTDKDKCVTCHETEFCATCHKKTASIVAPTHPADFKNTHRTDPAARTDMCNACHSQKSCNKPGCHQEIPLPHAGMFKQGGDTAEPYKHSSDARTKSAQCATCHKPDMCLNCHLTALPTSHKTPDWYKGHKGMEGASREFCNLCHDNKKFCGMCHKAGGVSHTADWTQKHTATKAKTDLAGCAQCHRKDSPTCTKCHSDAAVKKRHEDTSHKLCSDCHINFKWKLSGPAACAKCHKEPAEQSEHSKHTDCTKCHSVHELKVNDCTACHKKTAAKLKPDHRSASCAACHKPHKWGDEAKFTTCASGKCHEGIKEKGLHATGAHQRCGDCHDSHTSETKWPDRKDCVKCHKKEKGKTSIKTLCDGKGLDCNNW